MLNRGRDTILIGPTIYYVFSDTLTLDFMQISWI